MVFHIICASPSPEGTKSEHHITETMIFGTATPLFWRAINMSELSTRLTAITALSPRRLVLVVPENHSNSNRMAGILHIYLLGPDAMSIPSSGMLG
jgi:hypothetical protein